MARQHPRQASLFSVEGPDGETTGFSPDLDIAQREAYIELMGKEPPENKDGQWLYTGRKKADKGIIDAATRRK